MDERFGVTVIEVGTIALPFQGDTTPPRFTVLMTMPKVLLSAELRAGEQIPVMMEDARRAAVRQYNSTTDEGADSVVIILFMDGEDLMQFEPHLATTSHARTIQFNQMPPEIIRAAALAAIIELQGRARRPSLWLLDDQTVSEAMTDDVCGRLVDMFT